MTASEAIGYTQFLFLQCKLGLDEIPTSSVDLPPVFFTGETKAATIPLAPSKITI